MTKTKINLALSAMVVPLCFLLLWQGIAAYTSSPILPSPLAVLEKWYSCVLPVQPYTQDQGSYIAWLFSGEMVQDIYESMYRILSGFFIGLGFALPLGLLIGRHNSLQIYFNPFARLLRSIPASAFLPIAIILLGMGNGPAITLIAFAVFLYILTGVITGIKDAILPREHNDAKPISLVLLAAAPQIISAIRIGMSIAFFLVVVVEVSVTPNGLGHRIFESEEFFAIDKMMSGILTLGILGWLLDSLILHLSNYYLARMNATQKPKESR